MNSSVLNVKAVVAAFNQYSRGLLHYEEPAYRPSLKALFLIPVTASVCIELLHARTRRPRWCAPGASPLSSPSGKTGFSARRQPEGAVER